VSALRSPFSNRPTRVVTVPLSPLSLGISSSSLQVDPLNVIQHGCGGIRLSSMGASLHQSFPNRCGPDSFPPSRHVSPCRTVNFYGAIPGGTAFPIPQGSLSNENDTGTGFNWTADIAGGTDVIFIANDERGIASGGYVTHRVADSVNSSCLNNYSPSSTAGNPAGGSYPTSTSVSSSNDSGSHS
jgi:hypothetical protein